MVAFHLICGHLGLEVRIRLHIPIYFYQKALLNPSLLVVDHNPLLGVVVYITYLPKERYHHETGSRVRVLLTSGQRRAEGLLGSKASARAFSFVVFVADGFGSPRRITSTTEFSETI